MKKISLMILASFLSFSSFAGEAKINVCHQSSEGDSIDISVSPKAWPAFERQGDYLGLCSMKKLEEDCGDLGVNLQTMACNPVLESNMNDLVSEYVEYQDAVAVDEPFTCANEETLEVIPCP